MREGEYPMADPPFTERVTALQRLLEQRYPAFQWSVKDDPAPITLGILDPTVFIWVRRAPSRPHVRTERRPADLAQAAALAALADALAGDLIQALNRQDPEPDRHEPRNRAEHSSCAHDLPATPDCRHDAGAPAQAHCHVKK